MLNITEILIKVEIAEINYVAVVEFHKSVRVEKPEQTGTLLMLQS